MEEWKTIEEYPTHRVSNFGRVQNIKTGNVLKGCAIQQTRSRTAYVKICIYNQRVLAAHRLVATTFIPNPENLPQVDHIDGNGLNNHISNLRWCSVSQNEQNRAMQCNNTTGFKGVHKNHKRWQARISLNTKTMCLGTFDTPEEAARAYDAKATEIFGEFAKLNFPPTTV